MSIEVKKAQLQRQLADVDELWLLLAIEKLLSTSEDNSIAHLSGNIEDSVDIARIKAERPLRPLDKEAFDQLISSLTWEQSIEELENDLQ